MDLIIKIPDEDYKFIKDLQSLIIGGRGGCRTIQQNVINAIRNGTPCNPSGDAISRKALIYAIKTECNPYGKPTIDYESGKKVLKIIESAQTVEPFDGEWGKWLISEIRCPICSGYFQPDGFSTEELNKCPHCGAEMRKGGAE